MSTPRYARIVFCLVFRRFSHGVHGYLLLSCPSLSFVVLRAEELWECCGRGMGCARTSIRAYVAVCLTDTLSLASWFLLFAHVQAEAEAGHTHESSTVQRTYFKRHGLGTQGVQFQAKHTFLDLPGSPSRSGGHANLPVSSVRPRLISHGSGVIASLPRQPGGATRQLHSRTPSDGSSSSPRATPAAAAKS